MVPAPTTAALKTNMAAEAIGGGRGRGASCLRGSMCPQDRTVEEELARIASAAHGVVTRSELLRTGITADEIRWRVRTGSLLRQHRGVYRVGHRAPSIEARYLAAVLAGGEGALLSGRAAAHLLGLVKGTAPAPEVMALTERRIEGVRTHRSRAFDARDATIVSGIPVTTVPRTLVDIAAVLPVNALARAWGPLRSYPRQRRGRARSPAVEPGRAEAPPRYPRGRSRHALGARISISRAPARRRAPAPHHRPPGRWPPGRLPLAGASADRRARRLPIPQLAPLLGAGSASRARSASGRRRGPPL